MHGLAEWLRASRDARARALSGCLERVRALEPSLHAWACVEPQPSTGSGPLDGIPFGVKDIIDTKDLATEYGSPVYAGRRAAGDAAIVSHLRQIGAVLMGKTHTAAFAYRTPAPTRNPRDPGRTPGGSSSGSAAAVAAGMVPLALGTQTQGSVLRPASYCGIAGFKPTYGLFPMEGVLLMATSLDTLGFFTATAADMLAFWEALGHDAGDDGAIEFGVPEPSPEVDPPMAAAFDAAVSRLRDAGVSILAVPLGDMPERLNEASRVVMCYEGARAHDERYREHGSRLADLADLVLEGRGVSGQDYREALACIAECRIRVAAFHARTPVILLPAATGPAPAGLASTGDPRMNAPWTALGTPAIAIPMGAWQGLPLGLQLVAACGDDGRLLRAASRVERVLSLVSAWPRTRRT